MNTLLQKKLEAVADLLNVGYVLDEADSKLLEAKCEIQRLNKQISDESLSGKIIITE